jgi:hypothetical protein
MSKINRPKKIAAIAIAKRHPIIFRCLCRSPSPLDLLSRFWAIFGMGKGRQKKYPGKRRTSAPARK